MKLQRLYNLCRQQSNSIRCLSNCRSHSTSAKPSSRETFLERVSAGPGLQEFFNVKPKLNSPLQSAAQQEEELIPYLPLESYQGQGRKVHFEIYGCQMNTNDTEVVWSIMKANGYTKSQDIKDADVVMIVTCAVREGAETKIWNRLNHLKALKEKRSAKKGPLQITVLGCMAERLKQKLLEKEKCVDVVAGPDSYKDLPRLLAISRHYQQSAINVILSLDETYGDVMPVRLNTDSPTAFVSIMRGCDNMCTYCIVPFTRGRERSRDVESIKQEVLHLRDNGVKEVTLLGQNVNSYRDISKEMDANVKTAPGFKTVYKPKKGGLPFSVLLQEVAEAVPEVRIRFTSPHPKDFSEDVLRVIRDYPNVCKNLHLPAQSGNDKVLERMRRGYTRDAYLQLVATIREYLPDVGLSSDFICGFCGETEEEFEDTVTLIEQVRYNVAFLFAYSMREKTTAHRRYKDDVPLNVKTERLQRMVKAFRQGATELHKMYEGRQELILIEGKSKRSDDCVFGRNDANIKVIVPIKRLPLTSTENNSDTKGIVPGDFVVAHIEETNSQVLKGQPLYITNLQDFYAKV
ncbi:CDK5RAP1-like protein [Calliphora vicina]|uniref:CDK5RAP1-like protein n=1 Tax=Calliphora vicina TaxID=7373 RepID=UPI00325B2E45